MPKHIKRNVAIAVFLTLIVLISAFALYYNFKPETQETMGLNGEAGIVTSTGQVIPFKVGDSLSTITVNNAPLNLDDAIYWRFWLNLKAKGDITDARLKAVRFRLTQAWSGGSSSWEAGTEYSGDRPLTSSTESWFQAALPVGQMVSVPIKYRDNLVPSVESAGKMLPFSEYDPSNGKAIRSARVEQASNFANYLPAGTYTLTYYCSVISVEWAWKEAGQQKTEVVTPSPAQISHTFSIVIGESGSLEISLLGEGSV